MSWLMVCWTKSWFHVYFYDSLYRPLWHNNTKPKQKVELELIHTSHHQIATTFPHQKLIKNQKMQILWARFEIWKSSKTSRNTWKSQIILKILLIWEIRGKKNLTVREYLSQSEFLHQWMNSCKWGVNSFNIGMNSYSDSISNFRIEMQK